MPARDIDAPLPKLGVIAVREPPDEFIRAGDAARLGDLLVRGVLPSPPQIVAHRAAEQRVFLKHDGDRIAQVAQRVAFDRAAVDAHLAP